MAKTHEMIFYPQKPDNDKIMKMIKQYFNSEASTYDSYNQATEKRKKFLNKIDWLVAQELRGLKKLKKILSIACGTCFREEKIRSMTEHSFSITGIDLSSEMCRIAKAKGHDVFEGDWLEIDLNGATFDLVLFLYSIGLCPSQKSRVQFMSKVAKSLKPGGIFFFDVMNINDVTEWGPEIQKEFQEKKLSENGYDLGDVFYRRIGADEVAFFHYFSDKEIEELVAGAGLEIIKRYYIDCNTNYGELCAPDRGAILYMVRKP